MLKVLFKDFFKFIKINGLEFILGLTIEYSFLLWILITFLLYLMFSIYITYISTFILLLFIVYIRIRNNKEIHYIIMPYIFTSIMFGIYFAELETKTEVKLIGTIKLSNSDIIQYAGPKKPYFIVSLNSKDIKIDLDGCSTNNTKVYKKVKSFLFIKKEMYFMNCKHKNKKVVTPITVTTVTKKEV